MHIFIKKMKKPISQTIEIPKGVEANLDENKLIVKGNEGENSRKFNFGKVNFKIEGNKIILENKKATKSEKKLINTISAHIRNMIEGVQKKFEYQLKTCFSHFPITVKVEGDKAIIKNFLGEKVDRGCNIPKNVEVKVEKEVITVSSIDKELAGQTAANFEKATKIGKRDRRVFQDGIFIINKAGKEI